MPALRNKTNSSRFYLILVLSFFVFVALGTTFVARFFVRGEYGQVRLRLRNGKTLYLVREARGLSSEVLYLTRNPDGCISPDPSSDYVELNPARPELIYSNTQDGLLVYDDPFEPYIHEPTIPWTDVKVNISRSKEPYYQDVRVNPAGYGATVTEVPLNETCWKNLFRKTKRRPL